MTAIGRAPTDADEKKPASPFANFGQPGDQALQRHVVKDESIFVNSGRLRLYLEDEDGTVHVEDLVAGDHRHVPTGRIHRYEAIERTELIEVSTPELDDVVRLQDDFGREGTNAP